jgi:derlin-1
MFKYPQDFNGVQILKTPQILYNWLPNRRGGMGGFGQAPTTRRTANDNNNNNRDTRNLGGRGYRLGDD